MSWWYQAAAIAIACWVGTAGSILAAHTPEATLTQKMTAIRQYQADFVQHTIRQRAQKVTELAQGVFVYKRPGHFRWDVRTPHPELWVSNGHTWWHYEPDLEQVSIRRIRDTELANTPIALFSQHPQKWIKQYHVTCENTPKGERFLLTPRDTANSVATIGIYFSQGQLVGLDLDDTAGQQIAIQFSQIRLNRPLAAHLFTFTPPHGVDVVETP